MLFNSIEFFLFFILVVPFYFILPQKYRWFFLLLGSYYFYMSWRAEYGLLLLVCTLINYICGRLIAETNNTSQKKFLLGFALVTSLGLLFAYKYADFSNESLRAILNFFGKSYDIPRLNILLPMGISFFTFQTLSYTIDVYRKQIKAEKHFGIFALYVSFFPQLVAGPIERSTHLLNQFYEEHSWDSERTISGLKYIAWGLFKKIVVADRLAIYVDTIFNNVHQYHGLSLLFAVYFFAFQIYCDFSGYSDIAIGIGKILGFRFMRNFNFPYSSQTITEFWRRWHISLSTWLRDYLYIPLGGNRKGKLKTYSNIFITMFLGGIWHGANWTFVVWGAYQGIMLIISKFTQDIPDKLFKIFNPFFLKKESRLSFLNKLQRLSPLIRIFFTFQLVSLGWIFFRANNLNDAVYVINNIFKDFNFVKHTKLLRPCFYATAVLLAVEWVQIKVNLGELLRRQPVALRWGLYYALFFVVVIFGVTKGRPFIYFQF